MSKKREREYARRRYSEWQTRQAAKAARTRQLRVVLAVVLGVVAAAVVITLVVVAARPDAVETAASDTETAAETSDPNNPCGPSTADTEGAGSGSHELPDPAVAAGRTWEVTLQTSCGDITLSLDGEKAPQSVANFVTLAKAGFFDNTPCHRLTTSGIYVLQCGDPTGEGTGGPGYSWGPIENAPADDVYPAGTIAMARLGGDADSQGSQFFIVYKESKIPSDAAGGYSVFGTVDSGLDVVSTVADGGTAPGNEQPARPISIKGVKVSE